MPAGICEAKLRLDHTTRVGHSHVSAICSSRVILLVRYESMNPLNQGLWQLWFTRESNVLHRNFKKCLCCIFFHVLFRRQAALCANFVLWVLQL